jgi:hypothetical protein
MNILYKYKTKFSQTEGIIIHQNIVFPLKLYAMLYSI